MGYLLTITGINGYDRLQMELLLLFLPPFINMVLCRLYLKDNIKIPISIIMFSMLAVGFFMPFFAMSIGAAEYEKQTGKIPCGAVGAGYLFIGWFTSGVSIPLRCIYTYYKARKKQLIDYDSIK